MTTKNRAATALVLLGLLATTGSVYAVPTLTYDPTNYAPVNVDPFTALDWNSAGSAVTTGFVPDGATVFTTTFWADAVAIKSGASTISGFLAAAGVPDGAEFTIEAVIQETATPLSATATQFTAVGGTFNIYYNPLANAVLATGAGITDGDLVISGVISPGDAGVFALIGAGGGTGTFTFEGAVNYTNPMFINPDLARSLAVSTIQFGTSRTDGVPPTGLPGANGTSIAGIPAGALIFQADANQSFTPVPEPGTIALMGLALVGIARARRRHVASA